MVPSQEPSSWGGWKAAGATIMPAHYKGTVCNPFANTQTRASLFSIPGPDHDLRKPSREGIEPTTLGLRVPCSTS